MAVVMFVTINYTEQIRIDAIHELSGNIKVQTKSNGTIIEIASRKDQKVFKATNTTAAGLDDSIQDTPLIIDASNCLVAAEILRSFGTVQNDQLAEQLINKANDSIQTINGNSPTQISPDIQKTSGFNAENNGTFN